MSLSWCWIDWTPASAAAHKVRHMIRVILCAVRMMSGMNGIGSLSLLLSSLLKLSTV